MGGEDVNEAIANPVSPIRDRIFNITIDKIPLELKVEGFNLKAEDNFNMKKGYIRIIGVNDKYISNFKYDEGVEIGRLSVYTNEFKINKLDINPKQWDNNYSFNKKSMEKLSEKIEILEFILNRDNSFDDIIELAKSKGEMLEKQEIKIAHKNFKKIRKNKEDEEKLTESLNKKVKSLEYYKNEEETRKKQDEILLELKTTISKNYDDIKKQLLELGYKENNEKYFAFD